MLETRRFDDAGAFLDVAGPFLEAREPEHMLTLGSAGALAARGGALQAGALVVALDRGRVLATALWTGPWEVVLSEVDDPRAIPALVQELAAEPVPGVHGPAEHADAFAAEWSARTGAAVGGSRSQRIHALERVIEPRPAPGRLRRAEPADRDLIAAWMGAFHDEAIGEAAPRQDVAALADEFIASPNRTGFVWDDGGPAATACTTGRTPHGIRVGAVYTPPERRNRGYASALVAAISARELAAGRRWCFLFTDLGNPTSNRIYRAIGYEPVRDIEIRRFGPARG